jgi:DNA-binding NarL/FixJ family response regulator
LRKLTEQIRTVHTGEIYLFSSIATEVVAGYLGKHPEVAKDPYEKLTDREKQVLKLIAEGHSHKEITGCVHATAGNDMKSAWTPRLTSGSLV